MFDIGFTELVLIAVVSLLVIGPERLPGAIRTGSAWLSRFRRSFNDIKREVEQELHNDAVMQDLKRSGNQLRDQANSVEQQIRDHGRQLSKQRAANLSTKSSNPKSAAPESKPE